MVRVLALTILKLIKSVSFIKVDFQFFSFSDPAKIRLKNARVQGVCVEIFVSDICNVLHRQ